MRMDETVTTADIKAFLMPPAVVIDVNWSSTRLREMAVAILPPAMMAKVQVIPGLKFDTEAKIRAVPENISIN